MIENIEGKRISIRVEKEKLILPNEIQIKVEENWKKVIKENPNLWDGEIAYISGYNNKNNDIEIVCKKTNYSHYIYDERIGLPNEYKCDILSAGCLLETLDGYFLIGELGGNTSYKGMLQISGGNVDNADIIDNEIDIVKTILRETIEEININLLDEKQVHNLTLKYINVHDRHSIELIATGVLNMTANQMQKHYENYLNYLGKNNPEIEFEKIHFIKKNNAIEFLNKMDNPKRNYLLPLIFEESKSK